MAVRKATEASLGGRSRGAADHKHRRLDVVPAARP
jgi:hypothetical protein